MTNLDRPAAGRNRYLVRWGSAPIINGIAAVFSVLAGALASFFTGSIRQSLGLPAAPEKGTGFAVANWEISFEACVFWMLVFLAAALFAWTKYADSAVDNEHKTYVGKALQGLESMPPSAFLDTLANEYVSTHKQLAKLRGLAQTSGVNDSDIESAICFVLRSLAKTIEAYDGHLGRSYRISLLLFVRSEWHVEKLNRVVDVEMLNRDQQLGVLESYSSMSITHPTNSTIQPLNVKSEFAYPIHKVREKNDAKNLLPGPPIAFNSAFMFECHTVDPDLSNLKPGFVDDNQRQAFSQFFTTGAGTNVKSFVSMAVPANNWNMSLDIAGSESAGVLHIEASEINVMKSASGFFWPVAQPYLLLLSDLLALRSGQRST